MESSAKWIQKSSPMAFRSLMVAILFTIRRLVAITKTTGKQRQPTISSNTQCFWRIPSCIPLLHESLLVFRPVHESLDDVAGQTNLRRSRYHLETNILRVKPKSTVYQTDFLMFSELRTWNLYAHFHPCGMKNVFWTFYSLLCLSCTIQVHNLDHMSRTHNIQYITLFSLLKMHLYKITLV